MDVVLQYTIAKDSLPEVAAKFRNFDKYQALMTAAANKAIHYSCAQFHVFDFQPQRVDVQDMIKLKMQENVAMFQATIHDVQLRNAGFPSQWKDAVASKEQAYQDISLALNERDQRVATANGTLAVALQQLENEAATAADIMSQLNMTVKDFIAYLTNRALESHAQGGSPVKLALEAPARGSYATEL
ncbi:hypothetical protein WJX72_009162 [[Myrmecia] bisecta]|uniref:Band 7 domain-containing protein n=1 Tax=[Myrmecia] bisecta TaxID=41462 RepID=A0AAW1R8P3_9CHLO